MSHQPHHTPPGLGRGEQVHPRRTWQARQTMTVAVGCGLRMLSQDWSHVVSPALGMCTPQYATGHVRHMYCTGLGQLALALQQWCRGQ